MVSRLKKKILKKSLAAQMVKNLSPNAGDWDSFLGRKISLKGMAAHSSILTDNSMDRGAWRNTQMLVIANPC